MSHVGPDEPARPVATVPLVLTGSRLRAGAGPGQRGAAGRDRRRGHGVTSALLVVARMVGMLVGISALTTIGLRRYYAEQADLPAPMDVCGQGDSRCDGVQPDPPGGRPDPAADRLPRRRRLLRVAGVRRPAVFRHADTREIAPRPRAGSADRPRREPTSGHANRPRARTALAHVADRSATVAGVTARLRRPAGGQPDLRRELRPRAASTASPTPASRS